jgi:hypothetical protein
MKPVVITPDWATVILRNLNDLNVTRVLIDPLPQHSFCVQFIAVVKDDIGREWNARLVLDECDPILISLDKISDRLREIITDPKYRIP